MTRRQLRTWAVEQCMRNLSTLVPICPAVAAEIVASAVVIEEYVVLSPVSPPLARSSHGLSAVLSKWLAGLTRPAFRFRRSSSSPVECLAGSSTVASGPEAVTTAAGPGLAP